ncbi:hypothetical protein BAE44_0015602 [Dichanthelium oligosanthes]|uniref:Uncharacterized protein n=1 Tax=Dichanthelium oligosanthes TaxID=888268 RepID=A0A1E5VE10_9POAL|nr:hypothetical protein BAE44_0015602 [Dichanthelium oligosanthes]
MSEENKTTIQSEETSH